MGYTTALWHSFGEALAAVAGALMGLLFVAVSVKSDVLAASVSLRSRAAQTLVLFGTSVFIALYPGGSATVGSLGLGAARCIGGLGYRPAHLGPASWSCFAGRGRLRRKVLP